MGSKKEQKIAPTETIQNLQGHIDLLNKKQAHLEKKVENEKIIAKKKDWKG